MLGFSPLGAFSIAQFSAPTPLTAITTVSAWSAFAKILFGKF